MDTLCPENTQQLALIRDNMVFSNRHKGAIGRQR